MGYTLGIRGRNGTENTLKDSGGVLCHLGRVAEFGGLMRERTKARHDAARGRGVRFWAPSKAEPPSRKNWLSSPSVEGTLVQQITEISRDVTA